MSPSDRATTDQLRAEIDEGSTGSKVAASDPAMAPLGTDDEAAGTPSAPEVVAQAIRRETSGVKSPAEARHGLGAAWILVAVGGVVATAFVLLALVLTGA